MSGPYLKVVQKTYGFVAKCSVRAFAFPNWLFVVTLGPRARCKTTTGSEFQFTREPIAPERTTSNRKPVVPASPAPDLSRRIYTSESDVFGDRRLSRHDESCRGGRADRTVGDVERRQVFGTTPTRRIERMARYFRGSSAADLTDTAKTTARRRRGQPSDPMGAGAIVVSLKSSAGTCIGTA